MKKTIKKKPEKLYLGRYVRFQTGLQDSVLNLYKKSGPSIDGTDNIFEEDFAEYYVRKIMKLCAENEIEVVFLTLPMYQEHVTNYSVWKKNLGEVIDASSINWLDMQEGEGYVGFDTSSFQNTYSKNQHMTYNGSLVATYKLAEYLRNQWPTLLPNRSTDKAWRDKFYGEEGYFENHALNKSDKKFKILNLKAGTNGPNIEQIDFLQFDNHNTILVKVLKTKKTEILKDFSLHLKILYTENKSEKTAFINVKYNKLHKPFNTIIFSQNIKKEIQINKILQANFIPI